MSLVSPVIFDAVYLKKKAVAFETFFYVCSEILKLWKKLKDILVLFQCSITKKCCYKYHCMS